MQAMKVIGLMSGTSADGIDAVLAEISGTADSPRMRQIAFESMQWGCEEREVIELLIAGRGDARTVSRAGFMLGKQFAEAAIQVVEKSGLSLEEIDLVGSHGQTVWHEVGEGGMVQSTLQIGEAALIAEKTGLTTVADFRVADVAAGGQGAPLIPIFDQFFLRPEAGTEGCRAVQNIGGIGNVTFLPPEGRSEEILAFDTGPGNVLIDWAASQATEGAQQFDKDGELAARGRCNNGLVEGWLEHSYFRRHPPKSTGRELFSHALAERYSLEAARAGLSGEDFAATVTELTAASIAESYRLFAPVPVADIIVCGGGARNPVLLERLQAQLNQRCERQVSVRQYDELSGVPGDEESKEALGFALLAWLAIQGRSGNVPACTGASGERILGKIAPGRNLLRLLRKL